MTNLCTAFAVLFFATLLSAAGLLFWRGRQIARRIEKIQQACPLWVWFDGWTWVVASDRADAKRLLLEHYEGTSDTLKLLKRVPQTELIALWLGDPDGPIIEKPAVVWAKERGRGFLATTEY
jgi:hypothetical protein